MKTRSSLVQRTSLGSLPSYSTANKFHPCYQSLPTDLQERAQRPFASTPRPFLRWAGSKQLHLSHILPLLPTQFGTYYEPFLGSGALFFLLRPVKAVLTDNCRELVETFEAVRDNVSAVLRYLDPLWPDKNLFYEIRDNRAQGTYKRAAEFIFLNKSCWNGLYRVNAEGIFNVPFGRPKSNGIVDPKNLKACSITLLAKQVKLRVSDFEVALSSVNVGDLVYLDPPYVTRHNNNGFRDWNETLFSWSDQQRLASIARVLADRGAHVIVSNADHAEIVDLYPGFDNKRIMRKSTLASDASKRGSVTEIILYKTKHL